MSNPKAGEKRYLHPGHGWMHARDQYLCAMEVYWYKPPERAWGEWKECWRHDNEQVVAECIAKFGSHP
jgi:hypothetical protein